MNKKPVFERPGAGKGSGGKSCVPVSYPQYLPSRLILSGFLVYKRGKCGHVEDYTLLLYLAIVWWSRVPCWTLLRHGEILQLTNAEFASVNQQLHVWTQEAIIKRLEDSSVSATSVCRLRRLHSTVWDFFTHSPSDMAGVTSSLQLRGTLLYIWEKEGYAVLG